MLHCTSSVRRMLGVQFLLAHPCPSPSCAFPFGAALCVALFCVWLSFSLVNFWLPSPASSSCAASPAATPRTPLLLPVERSWLFSTGALLELHPLERRSPTETHGLSDWPPGRSNRLCHSSSLVCLSSILGRWPSSLFAARFLDFSFR